VHGVNLGFSKNAGPLARYDVFKQGDVSRQHVQLRSVGLSLALQVDGPALCHAKAALQVAVDQASYHPFHNSNLSASIVAGKRPSPRTRTRWMV
jgi:hypothetical protein